MNTITDDLARDFVGALTGNDGAALLALLSEDIQYWLPGETPISARRRSWPCSREFFLSSGHPMRSELTTSSLRMSGS